MTSFGGGGDGNGRKDDGNWSLGPNGGDTENDSGRNDIVAVSMVDGCRNLRPNLGIKVGGGEHTHNNQLEEDCVCGGDEGDVGG